ncbi:MAG: hypothetical protein ABSB75_05035 [Candidatus Limnocylindrales bacterium]
MDHRATQDTAANSPEETRRRLTSEVAEVEAAIALVASGSASSVTLTGLRFGEQVARRFRAEATASGIRLEPILWPEDAGCDLIVRKIDE